MARMALVVCMTAIVSLGVPAFSADHASTLLVADFESGVESALGGYFQSIGGAPTAVTDRITALGTPKVRTWRIDVQASAPPDGVGGVIPLFDNRCRRCPICFCGCWGNRELGTSGWKWCMARMTAWNAPGPRSVG